MKISPFSAVNFKAVYSTFEPVTKEQATKLTNDPNAEVYEPETCGYKIYHVLTGEEAESYRKLNGVYTNITEPAQICKDMLSKRQRPYNSNVDMAWRICRDTISEAKKSFDREMEIVINRSKQKQYIKREDLLPK